MKFIGSSDLYYGLILLRYDDIDKLTALISYIKLLISYYREIFSKIMTSMVIIL